MKLGCSLGDKGNSSQDPGPCSTICLLEAHLGQRMESLGAWGLFPCGHRASVQVERGRQGLGLNGE